MATTNLIGTSVRATHPIPLPSDPRTAPLPPAALIALARLELALSPADVATQEAAPYVRSQRTGGDVR
ncbi:hypothetical protein ACN2WE_05270 [Streptomyces sp. cg28]|uniref:hypothetical protein n=1 Tax=Streptomyces sp. cg28 TaxID=3403457 RepID=UPI003B20FBA8